MGEFSNQFPGGQFPGGRFPPGQFGPGPIGGPAPTPINFAGMSTSYSDFQPARSKRHPIMMTLSVLCLIGGGIMLAYGVIKVVDQASTIRDDAAASGNVALPGETPGVAHFVAGRAERYTVYVDLDTSSENLRDDVVAETTCVAQFGNDEQVTLRGNRQGTSNTLGDLSSIGSFSATEGPVAVICGQSGTSRPSATIRFLITPGSPSSVLDGIWYIFGGAGLLAASLVLAIFGFRRKYQTTMIAA